MTTATLAGRAGAGVSSRATTTESRRAMLWQLLSTTAIATLCALFTYANVAQWLRHGNPNGLVLAAQQAVLVVCFIIRRRPIESSRKVSDWTVGLVGSFAILLLRPQGSALFGLGDLLMGVQLLGAGLSLLCTLYLGRSFGLVAANRGVKVRGPYRVVRHPIYASYVLVDLGYVLSWLSLANVLIFALVYAAQVRRIFAEEAVLLRDPAYRRFAATTRYRLIPFVF